MKYYILKNEQVVSNGELSEYANVVKYNDMQSAVVAYYQALSNVSADLGRNHTFMAIRILDSLANVLKSENVGTYLTELPPTPEPEPEVEPEVENGETEETSE